MHLEDVLIFAGRTLGAQIDIAAVNARGKSILAPLEIFSTVRALQRLPFVQNCFILRYILHLLIFYSFEAIFEVNYLMLASANPRLTSFTYVCDTSLAFLFDCSNYLL